MSFFRKKYKTLFWGKLLRVQAKMCPRQLHNILLDFLSPSLLNLFISSDSSICLTLAFHQSETLTMLLPQLPLIFLQTQNGTDLLIAQLMAILVLLLDFLIGYRLESMYISLIIYITSASFIFLVFSYLAVTAYRIDVFQN